jgi:hypothetical protein
LRVHSTPAHKLCGGESDTANHGGPVVQWWILQAAENVSDHRERRRSKVLDFGIAKALSLSRKVTRTSNFWHPDPISRPSE